MNSNYWKQTKQYPGTVVQVKGVGNPKYPVVKCRVSFRDWTPSEMQGLLVNKLQESFFHQIEMRPHAAASRLVYLEWSVLVLGGPYWQVTLHRITGICKKALQAFVDFRFSIMLSS